MTKRMLILAAAALLSPPPAAGQGTAPRCEPIDEPRPAANGREAEERARSAARTRVANALRDDVVESARRAGVATPAGVVVLEVRGRRADRTSIHRWHSNVTDDMVREVLARHADRLATLPGRDETLHFRLDTLAVPDVPVADTLRVECAPRLADPRQFTQQVARIAERTEPLPAGSSPRVLLAVRMLVTREGEVAYARLVRRGSVPGLDEAVLDAARDLRFVPATVGGHPVDVWAEQPVEIHLPVRPRERRRT